MVINTILAIFFLMSMCAVNPKRKGRIQIVAIKCTDRFTFKYVSFFLCEGNEVTSHIFFFLLFVYYFSVCSSVCVRRLYDESFALSSSFFLFFFLYVCMF